MSAWAGPLFAAATLLLLASVPKILRPDDAVRALRSTGLPSAPVLVRALGVAEAAVGLYALSTGSRLGAVLVAVSYLGFSGFVLLARTREGVVSSCGCFGRPDTPPTVVHVVVTTLLAAGALAAVLTPVGSPTTLVGRPAQAAALLLLTGICVAFAYLALAVLPTLDLHLAPEKP